jgi:hypothetical protein
MSVARTNTQNTMGVRRLMSGTQRSFRSSRPGMTGYVTLGRHIALGTMGDDTSDAASTLVAAGYNPLDVQQLVAQGATAQQLYNLPYGPGTSAADMSEGIQSLNGQLTGSSFVAGTPMNYDPTGFLYPAAINSLGPAATLVSTAPAGTTTSALEYSAGPLGTALTAGPPLPSGQPSAPSLYNTAASIVAGTPAQPASPCQNQLLCWLEANWIWIAIFAGAAIVVPPLIKKL